MYLVKYGRNGGRMKKMRELVKNRIVLIVVLGCAIKMQIQKNGQNYEIICDIRNKDEDQGTG